MKKYIMPIVVSIIFIFVVVLIYFQANEDRLSRNKAGKNNFTIDSTDNIELSGGEANRDITFKLIDKTGQISDLFKVHIKSEKYYEHFSEAKINLKDTSIDSPFYKVDDIKDFVKLKGDARTKLINDSKFILFDLEIKNVSGEKNKASLISELVLAGKEESNDISYIARPFYFEKHKKETKEYWHLNFEKSDVIKTKLGFILPTNMNYQELYLLDESDTTYKLSDVNDSKKNDGEELVPEKINVYIIKSLDNLKN